MTRWVATAEGTPINVLLVSATGEVKAQLMDPGEGLIPQAELPATQALNVTGELHAGVLMLGGQTYTAIERGDRLDLTQAGVVHTLVRDRDSDGCPDGTSTIMGELKPFYQPIDGTAVPLDAGTTELTVYFGTAEAPVSSKVTAANGTFKIQCAPMTRYLLKDPDFADAFFTDLVPQKLRRLTLSGAAPNPAEKRLPDMAAATKISLQLTGFAAGIQQDWLQVRSESEIDRFSASVQRPLIASSLTKVLTDSEISYDYLAPTQKVYATQYTRPTIAGFTDVSVLSRAGQATLNIVEGQTNQLSIAMGSTSPASSTVTWDPGQFTGLLNAFSAVVPGSTAKSNGMSGTALGLGFLFGASLSGSATGTFNYQSPVPSTRQQTLVHQAEFGTSTVTAGSYSWTTPLAASNVLTVHGAPVQNLRINGLPATGTLTNLGRFPVITWDAPVGVPAPTHYQFSYTYEWIPPGGPQPNTYYYSLGSMRTHGRRAQAFISTSAKGAFSLSVTAVWEASTASAGWGSVRTEGVGSYFVGPVVNLTSNGAPRRFVETYE